LLLRLAQARLLRRAWLESDPAAHPDLPVEALKFLNAPLGLVSPARLASAFEALNLDPDPLAHLPDLLDLLELDAQQQPGLEVALRDGIPSVVLNARYHYEESQIIAGAGAYGSVIIATNMAGRGVDIKLGGELAEQVLAAVNHVLEQAGKPDPYNMTLAERRSALQALTPAQRGDHHAEVDFFLSYMQGMERVRELGGLHVIGGTRHEARRIDNQLRGRAARQGDPGSSRFFISMEDELLVRFGSLEAEGLLEQEQLRGGDPLLPIPAAAGRRVIEAAQNRVENENYEIRKHLLDYDDVINAQRLAIYKQRDRILGKANLSDDLAEMLEAELDAQARATLQTQEGQSWQFIAWAERLQPELTQAGATLLPSWPLQVVLQKGLPDLAGQVEAGRASHALLELAERALLAEQRFVEAETERQCQAALTAWHSAVAERMEAVDALLDSLEPGQSAGPSRAAAKALSEAAGMPIQLSEPGWRLLKENPRSAAIEVLDQIEATLFQDAASHISVVLERLLGRPPALDLTEPPLSDPQELPVRAQAAVVAVFQTRWERLLGAQGELARSLAAALPELNGPLGEDRSLALLELMRVQDGGALPNGGSALDKEGALPDQATTAGKDQGAAPIPSPASPRLTYIFLADELLSNTRPDEIADQALDHLLAMQQALKDELGAETLNQAFRALLLATIDERWVEYLTRLEELRYEVRLEGMAHNDPLVMYKSKASGAYGALLAELRRVAVAHMFTFPLVTRPATGAEASSLEKATPRLTSLKLG
jgi:preprotein translocase subunit SecA